MNRSPVLKLISGKDLIKTESEKKKEKAKSYLTSINNKKYQNKKQNCSTTIGKLKTERRIL